MPDADRIHAGQVVLPCRELEETLAFYVDRLGFRLEAIYPADDPDVAVICGHGLRIQLERGAETEPGILRLLVDDPLARRTELQAPNGTRIELAPADPPVVMPPVRPSLVVSESGDGAAWGTGRAGMLYRDLIPDRQGGSVIASHIRIPAGGPVPDYVHFHKIRFQMIYCYRGWVRLVYEDQGPPFLMRAGDCVLQPPRIRHRVLECSPGLEVIEIGCPADHETFSDPDLALPTAALRPERDFEGQRFVRHEVDQAVWEPFRLDGFVCRDTGIGTATGGLASARVARPQGRSDPAVVSHDAEILFDFVLAGAATLRCDGREPRRLDSGTAFVVPAGIRHALDDLSADLEILEVSLPAAFRTTRHGPHRR